MTVRKIKKSNKEYPATLKNIYFPPEELFVNGSISPSDNNAVAVVGTRRATYYGLESAEKIAYELALRGITVISGMARGIDSAAHRGALKAGGRTIAVMGSGHNYIYPRENRKLYDDIVKSGAVISEFPPGMPPLKANFPRRNRIISGMSKGVVVVEAPEKSGAMITVDFALEQGKEVFAVPGNVNSAKSSGTNSLIKEGAKLAVDVRDILEELKGFLDAGEIDRAVSGGKTAALRPKLESDEKIIFGVLNEEPKNIDEITEITNLPASRVSKALLKMELKKVVRAVPGENFIRVNA